MKGSAFLRIVEREYENMLSESLNAEERIPSEMVAPTPKNVLKFKQWFRFALDTTEINVGDQTITPGELIAYAALKRSEEPPHDPLFPTILKVLELYSNSEIAELFGSGLLRSLNK